MAGVVRSEEHISLNFNIGAAASGRTGLSRPPLNFRSGNLLCWNGRPDSARSRHRECYFIKFLLKSNARKKIDVVEEDRMGNRRNIDHIFWL
jgi:hypothetical protein